MKASDVQRALVIGNYPPFRYRQYLVVPNVFWGWDLPYEADLIAVSRALYASEIEIKVSKHDLLQDPEKRKHKMQRPSKISYFYYAMPEELTQYFTPENGFPETLGLIKITKDRSWEDDRYRAEYVRRAQKHPNSRKITEAERVRLLELAYCRIWK
jgi:hypothetical protein